MIRMIFSDIQYLGCEVNSACGSTSVAGALIKPIDQFDDYHLLFTNILWLEVSVRDILTQITLSLPL